MNIKKPFANEQAYYDLSKAQFFKDLEMTIPAEIGDPVAAVTIPNELPLFSGSLSQRPISKSRAILEFDGVDDFLNKKSQEHDT